MTEATHGYIGRCRNGHYCAAVIDSPDRPKNTAKWVRDFIAEGLNVERLTVETIRGMSFEDCRCDDPPPKDGGLFDVVASSDKASDE